MNTVRPVSRVERVLDTVTHGIGVPLSVAGLVLLVVFAALDGTIWHLVTCSVYGVTLLALYVSSTLYHGFAGMRLERFLHLLDHSAIYLLIAGTYTPFMLVCVRGGWGWSIFGVIWGLAVFGIVFKSFFVGRFKLVSMLLYLTMGWLVVMATKTLLARVPHGALVWLLIGGIMYTVGAVFYLWKKLPYNHCVWHVFVPV